MSSEPTTGEPRPWMESDVDRLARELHEMGERGECPLCKRPMRSRCGGRGEYSGADGSYAACPNWEEHLNGE